MTRKENKMLGDSGKKMELQVKKSFKNEYSEKKEKVRQHFEESVPLILLPKLP